MQKRNCLLNYVFQDLDQLKELVCDKYKLKLEQVQLLYLDSGEKWQTGNELIKTAYHILQPLQLNLSLFKSAVNRLDIPKYAT